MPELHQERPPTSVRGDVRRVARVGVGEHKASGARTRAAVFRPLRTMPLQVAYEYRARVYPWALRAIAAAESVHGRP